MKRASLTRGEGVRAFGRERLLKQPLRDINRLDLQ